ncbi:MAG TPA: thermonuclease family protein [Vitreimonas sp.]|uniref:thermonuclease family protein n=1 Tax=Vitreimonas sp. TaxID=3069702 RepID=UPI002D2F3382|nr:thermonuclease family protein [Vitreimonas sp.]HYD87345.1 thermonuclease family protein [Vitreimonas sp.]
MAVRFLRSGVTALAVAGLVLALALTSTTPEARGEPSAPAPEAVSWRVIDGDTFEDLATGDRYRLENIDTPETGPRARCSAERDLGDRATQQARTFIANARQLDIRRTGRTDRYDRIIAFIEIDGRDLGELMIAQGLARPWRGRREPWCDPSGNLIR